MDMVKMAREALRLAGTERGRKSAFTPKMPEDMNAQDAYNTLDHANGLLNRGLAMLGISAEWARINGHDAISDQLQDAYDQHKETHASIRSLPQKIKKLT